MLNLELKRKLLAMARAYAPMDTGNLRYNAIKGKAWTNPNKFIINYSTVDAYYIEYLENKEFAGGSETKKNKHKGFIEKTYLDMAARLNNYFNRGKSMPSYRHPKQGEFSLERSLRHIKSAENNRVIAEVEREIVRKTIEVN